MIRTFSFLALLPLILHSQQPEATGAMISARIGGIVNNALSNVSTKDEHPDETSLVTRTRMAGARPLRFGFELGIDAWLLSSDKTKIAFGISYCRTTANYHYSYLSEDPTNRPGYSKVVHSTQLDVLGYYNAFNISGGIRNRLANHFYLTTSLVLYKPFRTRTISNGQDETRFVNTSSGDSTSALLYYNETEAVQRGGDANISLRFNLEYQFTFIDVPGRVYVYRNLGLRYKLPFWGIGVGLTLN